MLNNLPDIKILGNSLEDLIIFAGIFLAGAVIVYVFKRTLLGSLRAMSEKTTTKLDDFLVYVLDKKLMPVLYFGVLYVSFQTLKIPETWQKFLNMFWIILITFLGIRFIVASLEYAIRNYWLTTKAGEAKEKSIKALIPAMKVLIWGMGTVFLLDNLGFEIDTVIAGMGIGGIAVALASQAILGDLFSYFSILFDRPFEPEDFIIIGDFMGTIEHIGIKTTRIRSLSGEQIVFSNTDLTNSRLRNYKRMARRRISFALGVTYQTPLERMKEIPGIIKGVIDSIVDATFDRCHFSEFGDFSLNIETVYYVESSEYNTYMDIQQQINLAVAEEFGKRGIDFAYPTQTLFVTREGGEA